MGEKKLSIPVWVLSTSHVAHEILEYLELTFQRGIAKDTVRISYNETLRENKSTKHQYKFWKKLLFLLCQMEA